MASEREPEPTAAVPVTLSGGRAYNIYIGAGLLSEAGTLLAPLAEAQRSRHAVVVTQPGIAALWGETLTLSLRQAGFAEISVITFPAGERFKTLATMTRLYEKLYNLSGSATIDRKTLLIALGGGVVGDMAGFLAATYLRGLDYVQVPTTLLAMVDSSVGGKTGVDFQQGKNLIGAFHQPRAVIVDTDTLKTLPAREVRAGMAEVVKYGVIRDPDLLTMVMRQAKAIRALDPETIAMVVRRSCEIKADVVVNDEREETGLRAILNYGHTIGHALESATRYRRYKHGEAVAIGMVSAACIGEAAGITPKTVREAVAAALRAQRLPLALPDDIGPGELIAIAGRDKKAESGRAKFVLARKIGDVALMSGIEEKVVKEGLRLQAQYYPASVSVAAEAEARTVGKGRGE